MNYKLSIDITKVLVPPGKTPYEDIHGASDSHDFALAVLEKNFDEVFGWSLGKYSQKSSRSHIGWLDCSLTSKYLVWFSETI